MIFNCRNYLSLLPLVCYLRQVHCDDEVSDGEVRRRGDARDELNWEERMTYELSSIGGASVLYSLSILVCKS